MIAIKDMTVEELYENFDSNGMTRMNVTESDDDVDVRAHTGFYDVIARLVKGKIAISPHQITERIPVLSVLDGQSS